MASPSLAWMVARNNIMADSPKHGLPGVDEPSTTLRCAIYTRKSTEEGLQQEFNTLDAQREAAEAYVCSQLHAGWIALAARYDDGGFTGANLERPALRRLLADIEAGKVDCVLVYKVDRLSRSLLDFARLMEVFERRKVSLVSITQPLNTTGSMGRLTLNILLSFAEFERQMIADRTRDKMAAARRKGKWVGGRPVLGYDIAAAGGKLLSTWKRLIRCKRSSLFTSSIDPWTRSLLRFRRGAGRRSVGERGKAASIWAGRSRNQSWFG